ncbi:MAG: CaiB/BaiF CoA-transferase family protein [Acidobacteria bacterium]|nr:CaiB/BaiF CoA-transferase family protein [Acidobacteriota bacterium]
MQPLEGITVLSVEQAVAAPFATRQLADLGARVIKIERPGVGDFARSYDATVRGESSHFVWLNRGKESLTLDVKRPGAATVLQRLLDRADVFVQNLAPGAAGRLGLGSSALRESHPRLVMCDISGYGSSGPYRDRKAYDLLVQAEAGLLSITGTPEEQVKVGISVADIAAGMYAYSGILTALLMRHRTGAGTVVEISMLEALTEWMGYPLYYGVYGGSPPQRSGARHAVIAPYGPFAGGDGEVVYLGIQNEREWEAFCASVLEQPGLAVDPRFASNAERVQHRDALDAEIETVFGRITTPEIVERLESARIANARLRTVQQLFDHPQLAARQRWREVETPVGPIRATLPPASLEGVTPVMGPVPALGADTDAILHELGFDAATVAEWRADGTI